MVTVARPNKDAMVRALDIYRDAMRPFIVINLGRQRGSSVPDDLRHRMIEAVRKGHKAHDAVDIGDFPHLVSSNWQSIFARSMQSSDRSRLFLIRDARNDASHPGSGDMERDSVTARLTDIADVLRNIGASEEARAVQGIRDGLSGATSASAARAMPDPNAVAVQVATKPAKRTVRQRVKPPPPIRDATPVSDSVPLNELNPGEGQTPRRLMTFPDGARRPLRYWYDLQVAVVAWLADTGRLTETACPINYVSRGAHRPYVSGQAKWPAIRRAEAGRRLLDRLVPERVRSRAALQNYPASLRRGPRDGLRVLISGMGLWSYPHRPDAVAAGRNRWWRCAGRSSCACCRKWRTARR